MANKSNISITTAFKYKLEMSLLIGKKYYEIPRNSVKTILISSDYDKNNMPIIYMRIRMSSTLYNQMVLNNDRATISFRLFKFDDKSVSGVVESYIEDNFTYVMPTDPNYNEAMEQYVSGSSTAYNDNADAYMEGYIALTNLKLVGDNVKLINTIVKDTDIMSIVHKFTSHMNMCIEPFDNRDHIDQMIIPPITTISKLLAYLNDQYCFYKNGYRYFRSFNTTYLLSANGNAVKEGINSFNTIIISICDPLDEKGKSNAIDLDRTNHAYIVYVDAKKTSISVDKFANKQYNSIIGVDTEGNTVQEELRVPPTPDSTEKTIITRTDSLDYIYNIKRAVESVAVILTVSKTEIDSSLFTPNKEYQIKHYSSSREYDGKYILSYKKEVLVQQGEEYIGNILFGLRRILED